VARHIFQAFPVWIYTQSNITQASYSLHWNYSTILHNSCCYALATLKHKYLSNCV
jgi:hypothetical protein